MLLTRSAVVAAARTRPAVFALQSRAASSSHGHHDHHQHDMTTYPPESFVNPFWGKVILFSLLTVAAVKYAPEPSEDVYLTRWIALYSTPRDYWLEINAKHIAQQEEVADNNILLSEARIAPIHRFRYPQSLTQCSPFLNMVGGTVDMRNVVPKTGR